MPLKTVKGDLVQLALSGEFNVVAHGCNCMCTMGAGIAKFIKQNFPEAYRADQDTKKGDRSKLGTCTIAICQRDQKEIVVVNAYTQYLYGRDRPHVDYGALASCMKWIASNFKEKKIGLPKIGAGLGGGDWDQIKAIMEEAFKFSDATVVEFSEK